jgi:hypothetical protein
MMMGVVHVHTHTHTHTHANTQVRPHETINIYHGQPICLMEFFRNASVPKLPYGATGIYLWRALAPPVLMYPVHRCNRYVGIACICATGICLSRALRVHMLTRHTRARAHTHTHTTHVYTHAHAYTFPT